MARDRTAVTEPLTVGQKLVAQWETGAGMSEPADLAEAIDRALACSLTRGWNCAKIESPRDGEAMFASALRELQLVR